MLKFEAKVLHSKNLVEVTLENGEIVFLTYQEWDSQQEEGAESIEVESVEGTKYETVLSEAEYSDETPEVIGFKEIK